MTPFLSFFHNRMEWAVWLEFLFYDHDFLSVVLIDVNHEILEYMFPIPVTSNILVFPLVFCADSLIHWLATDPVRLLLAQLCSLSALRTSNLFADNP